MKRKTFLTVIALVAAIVLGSAVSGVANASMQDETPLGAGGRLHGIIYGFNVWDELVTISWASVTAMQVGHIVERVSSNDGFYEMYLPSGEFDIVVEAPGYFTEEKSIFMGDGSDYGLDFVMERNNQPIPEFTPFALQMIVALSVVATILVVRKRKSSREWKCDSYGKTTFHISSSYKGRRIMIK
jgi:hypothetical protein